MDGATRGGTAETTSREQNTSVKNEDRERGKIGPSGSHVTG